MPDDMNAEAVETLAVQLVADASPLLDSVDAAVEQAKAKLTAIGEPVPEIQSAIQSLVAALEEEWAAMGLTVSPEVLARIQAITEAYVQQASSVTDVAEQMRLYDNAVKEIRDTMTQGVATGEVTSVPGTGGLRETQAIAGAQDRAARSTRNWFGQAFSLEGVIKKLGLRLLATVGPVAVLYKSVQFVVRTLREASQAAIAYDSAMFRLEVSVRAAQRVMGTSAGSIEQWRDAARDIADKYGLYTETAMIEVAASVRQLTLQFRLAATSAIALTDAGVAVATVFGTAPGGVANIMAQFVTTGQNAEALRQFGFDVGEVGLQAEATRMGLHTLYREMRDDEQIQVRLNAVTEQAAIIGGDAAEAIHTLAGETQGLASDANDALLSLGTVYEPVARILRAVGHAIKLFFIDVLKKDIPIVLSLVGILVAHIAGMFAAIKAQWDAGLRILSAQEFGAAYGAAFAEVVNTVRIMVDDTEALLGRLGDVENAAAEAAEEFAEKMAAALLVLKAKFAELADRIKNILREIDEAYAQDVLDVNEDMLRERQKKTEDYAREEERDLQDHLLKMRRMEEDYLLELEDAVRARDARQVLLLMRRHRIDERRANEDADIRRRERRQDYQQELQDMAEQANRRLRQLELEWRERRRVALEEHEAYTRQLIEQWLQIEGITAEGIQMLHDLLVAEFGPGSELVSIFDQASGLIRKVVSETVNGLKVMVDGMAKSVQAAVSVVQKTLAWMASERVGMGRQVTASGMGAALGASIAGFWGGGTGAGGNPYTGGYQGGGDFVATGPRTIRVGEGRPEAVSIRPFSGGAAAGGQGGGGRAKMEIDLNVKADPRLIVEATEAAMSEVADVFINITRVSREGRG